MLLYLYLSVCENITNTCKASDKTVVRLDLQHLWQIKISGARGTSDGHSAKEYRPWKSAVIASSKTICKKRKGNDNGKQNHS